MKTGVLRALFGPVVAVTVVGATTSSTRFTQMPIQVGEDGAGGHSGSIRGVVRFVDGTVPEIAVLSLADRGRRVAVRTKPDAQGRYTFTGLPPGTYDLSALGMARDAGGSFVRKGIAVGRERAVPVSVDIVLAPLPMQ